MFSWPEKCCRKLTKAGQFTAATETNPHLRSVCYYYPGITTNVIQQIKPLACLAPSAISKPSGSAMGFPEGTPNCLTRVRPTIWIFLASGKLAEMDSCLHVHMESLYVCLCQSLCERMFWSRAGFFVWLQLWPSSSLPAPSSPGLQDASLTGA